MKDIFQIIMLGSLAIGLIALIIQFTVWLNKFFMYPLGFGLSLLIILGFFEIINRAKE